MISFIVPAYNEEASVERCLDAIQGAMAWMDESYEVLVVEDASTDATAALARARGARILRVEHRHIAATRNAGAGAARGDLLVFVDADTLVDVVLLRELRREVEAGAVGGGCVPRFEGEIPRWWKLVYPVTVVVMRGLRLTGGACQFCTRDAFAAVGGFSERHYAAEDLVFAKALKRQGRFVVLKEPVLTSGRNLRAYRSPRILRLLVRLLVRGPDGFRSRRGLDLWYRPQREPSPPL